MACMPYIGRKSLFGEMQRNTVQKESWLPLNPFSPALMLTSSPRDAATALPETTTSLTSQGMTK